MRPDVINNLEAVREHLENLSNSDLMHAHNQKCEQHNDMDSQIYYNDDEFFEIFLPKSTDAIRACQYGDHRYTDDFVQFNGYANLDSFDSLIDHVDLDEIAECILENKRHFNINLVEEDEE